MAIMLVDGVEYEAEPGSNLLHACLSQGLDLPYFCWHPCLGSVGACRQCAVVQYQGEDDHRGRLVMACMTPVVDGVRISIEAQHARDFRASVIEWLMENHPHDCPVCEEGGECHLQDMTVMTGHTSRRYRGKKRTFANQYLGPFLNHEMNRCITCYRCVRYYDYAGGTDLQALGSRARMYFGRVEDGPLESPFAGNLVEVCPTGVFTDKPFSDTYTRKWDLQSAPSICPGCAVGCNTFPGERYGQLKRTHNRYHGEVNGYFLCDRGRFGFGFVNEDGRIRQAGIHAEGDLFVAIDGPDALSRLTDLVAGGSAIGIGSPRASLESNSALACLVGAENFCRGMSSKEEELIDLALDVYRAGAARIPSLREVEEADAVLVLGEDVLNTAPRVALALRQTVRNAAYELAEEAGIPAWQDAGVKSHSRSVRNPLFNAAVLSTEIDDIAESCINGSPERLAQVGFAVANAIDPDFHASEPPDAEAAEFVARAATALAAAERPLIIAGTAGRSAGLIKAAANVAWALAARETDPALLLVASEVNSFGVGLLEAGLDMGRALARAASGEVETLIVAENDLFRRADADTVRRALDKVRNVVVLDAVETPTAERADLVLPAATFAESTGTYVNCETRAQRHFEVFEPAEPIAPSWRWLAEAATGSGRNDMQWKHVDEVVAAVALLPELGGVADAAPGATYRGPAGMKVPREPHRYSGRTAMSANVNVHERKTPVDEETPFSFSMEGSAVERPSALIPFVWAAGWNSNQSVFKFQQEVGGALTGGDPGVRLLGGATPQDGLHGRFQPPDAAPSVPDGRFRLLPAYTIFGSDELSGRSGPILERGPDPYVAISVTDANRLGVGEGDGIRCMELERSFAVRVDPALSTGHAAVCVGLPGVVAETPDDAVQLVADPDFKPPGASAEVIARG